MEKELLKKMLERVSKGGYSSSFRAAARMVREVGRRHVPKTQGRAAFAEYKFGRKRPGIKGKEFRDVMGTHGKRQHLRDIATRGRKEGEMPHLVQQARSKERALQPRAMTGEGIARTLTRKEIMNNLRDMMCKINRSNTTDYQDPLLSQLIISPPYKGPQGKPEHPYIYPPQLLGVREQDKDQRQRLEGSAHTGSTFGGIVGSYGGSTGGSYRT